MAANTAGQQYLSGNITDSVRHMTACQYMIEIKGGYATLGLNGFLAQLITWCREELYSAIEHKPLREFGHDPPSGT